MDKKRMFAVGTVTVFAGYLAGVLTVMLGGGGGKDYVFSYVTAVASPDWWQAFLKGPFFVLLILCFGVFFFGWLLVYPLLYYKAYGYGYTAGLFLAALGTKGFLPLGLCLFPSAAAECALMIRAAGDAFPLSFSLFRSLKGNPEVFFSSLRGYFLQGLVLFQCTSFVLLWDLFMAPLILSGIGEII